MPFSYPEVVSPRLRGQYARLRQLDKAIPELQATLERLIQERRALRREVMAYPILTLPNELTCEIFINCLSPGRVMPTPLAPPLLLAQVCNQWRAITLALPEMWNRVRPRRLSTNTIQLLNLWLHRAGTLPISIGLSSHYPLPHTLPSWAALHSNKWEHVSLVLRDIELALLATWIKVCALKTLVIGPSERTGGPMPFVRGFKMAQNLHEVTLLRGLRPSDIDLPWAQLTTLNATGLAVPECVDVLRSGSRLVHCTFFIHSGSVPQLPSPRLRHPHLRQLILQYGTDHLDLLQQLELPSLTRIQLSLESGVENVTRFLEFAAQCPHIQHMSVEAASLGPAEFIQCLRATPAVTMLEFQAPCRWETWRGLTLRSLDGHYCLPALTQLRITDEGRWLDDTAYRTLVQMVRSRNGSSRDLNGDRPAAKLQLLSLMLLAHGRRPGVSIAKQLDDLRATTNIDICIESRNLQLYPYPVISE
ncbi:hypothetical protein C8F04DRAFT_1257812 [Mycena alexandri]|uniref:F-box domain-containing protein n=1 Tax=Mycena alexandri TaxID=1745969 RepID=A0AAD6SZY4_9AGAR|nr:hypothetical protein C8F04DRAFT_1257812 [Mycena alexandri]